MTQDFYTGTVSTRGIEPRPDSTDDEHATSNEIRADIDQTRASVGEKIDQLQARLDPNRLKTQAQETVQEMLTDTANSMTDYVRTHKDDMVNALADAARRNPLPTALVGLGVGWLILESMAGNKRDDDSRSRNDGRRDYDRNDYARWEYARYLNDQEQRSRFEGSTGRSVVSQGRGPSMEGDYPSSYADVPNYNQGGYPGTSAMRNASGSPEGYANGHHKNPVEKATDAVKDTVSDVSGEIKDRVEDVGQEIKERVGDVTQEVKERFSDATDEVRHQADRLNDRGQRMMQRGQRMGQRMGQRAGDRMDEWQQRARYEGRRRGRQVASNLEDNPLTYGALALAAGAAIALLLPQTRTENRAFGELRDQVMDKGQEAMESAKNHAQQVAEEIRPELEEKARQLVNDVKETGKEVAKDAAAELRPIVDKAVEKGKEGAMNAAQEVGIDPSKLTPDKPTTDKFTNDKPVLNRDTLAGEWKQVKGEVKRKWGQLTDDEMTQIEGNYDKLVGAIQKRYGYTRERTEQEVKSFFESQKAQKA